MPVRSFKMSKVVVAGVALLPLLFAVPPLGQAAQMQEMLERESGVAEGSNRPKPGSVRPTITMEEQIRPCYDSDGKGARALINVLGLENDEGNIRVQVYSDDPEEFLANGKKLLRVDVPISDLNAQVCVTFPRAGTYAMVVMHDRNANGRADILTEGFGFSRNPKLMFSKPDHDEVAIEVPEGVTEIDVTLNYLFRLGNKDRRRRKRR